MKSQFFLNAEQQKRFMLFLFQNGGLDITTALIYDAVVLFASAIHKLDMIQV